MSRQISLSSCSPGPYVTVIPNTFFDSYMPRANGEFLKIYLYLLRLESQPDIPLSLTVLADIFLVTENDVIRALNYWAQEQLIDLTMDETGNITAVRLKPIPEGPQTAAPAAGSCIPPQSAPGSARIPAALAYAAASPSADSAPFSAAVPPQQASAAVEPRHDYSMDQLAAFSSSDQGQQLFFIIQQYLGHPLSQMDMNTILYFHEDLHFSPDLIEYLFEYCISSGHKNFRYIEKVALNWAEQHVTTVSEAKSSCAAHNRVGFSVLKTFGINNRMITPDEQAYIDKWCSQYHFEPNMIVEACRRTMRTTHSPSFSYTDTILTNWKNCGAFTLSEVSDLDKAYSQKRAAAAKPVKDGGTSRNTAHAKPNGNKFGAFKQRQYDYDALEKKLAQKIHAPDDNGQP